MADAVNPLDPNTKPRGEARKAGVRRVNNVPLVLVGTALTIFFVAFGYVAMDRAQKQNKKVTEEAAPKPQPSWGRAANLLNKQFEAVVPAAAEQVAESAPAPAPAPAPASTDVPKLIVPVINLDRPPSPPPKSFSRSTDEAADRRQRERDANLAAALKAKTGVQIPDARIRPTALSASPSSPSSNDPVSIYNARLAQLRAAGVVPSGVGQ